jgi:hypothetical protein
MQRCVSANATEQKGKKKSRLQRFCETWNSPNADEPQPKSSLDADERRLTLIFICVHLRPKFFAFLRNASLIGGLTGQLLFRVASVIQFCLFHSYTDRSVPTRN